MRGNIKLKGDYFILNIKKNEWVDPESIAEMIESVVFILNEQIEGRPQAIGRFNMAKEVLESFGNELRGKQLMEK